MDDKALFVGIEAKPGHEDDVAELLRDARDAVEGEPGTHDWYAMRFGLALFAIFDTFPDNSARIKHLLGQVGRKLIASSFSMLDRLPDIRPANILAAKQATGDREPRLSLHVPLHAHRGREDEVAHFLRSARPMVEDESGTLTWYALRLGDDRFAIVDFFADEAGREAHLNGEVAEALMSRASELFADPLAIGRGEVLASKVSKRLEAAAM
jgi:quinol monooxygenase YgiN